MENTNKEPIRRHGPLYYVPKSDGTEDEDGPFCFVCLLDEGVERVGMRQTNEGYECTRKGHWVDLELDMK